MSNNEKLENIAIKVMNKMNLDFENKSLNYKNSQSIILILMIIGIILSLIRIIQECNKKKLLGLNKNRQAETMKQAVNEVCIKKNLLTMWRLNKIIKNKLSPEDYKAYGAELKRSIMETGPELTEEEIITLVEESSNV
jgi:uncharacterized membrane protein